MPFFSQCEQWRESSFKIAASLYGNGHTRSSLHGLLIFTTISRTPLFSVQLENKLVLFPKQSSLHSCSSGKVQGSLLQELWKLLLIAALGCSQPVPHVSQNLDPRFSPPSPGTNLSFENWCSYPRRLGGDRNPLYLRLLGFGHCDSRTEDLEYILQVVWISIAPKECIVTLSASVACRGDKEVPSDFSSNFLEVQWVFPKFSPIFLLAVSSVFINWQNSSTWSWIFPSTCKSSCFKAWADHWLCPLLWDNWFAVRIRAVSELGQDGSPSAAEEGASSAHRAYVNVFSWQSFPPASW